MRLDQWIEVVYLYRDNLFRIHGCWKWYWSNMQAHWELYMFDNNKMVFQNQIYNTEAFIQMYASRCGLPYSKKSCISPYPSVQIRATCIKKYIKKKGTMMCCQLINHLISSLLIWKSGCLYLSFPVCSTKFPNFAQFSVNLFCAPQCSWCVSLL